MLNSLFTRTKEYVSQWVKEKIDPELDEKLKLLPTKLNEFGYDPFGFSPEHAKWVVLPVLAIYRKYFRVENYGINDVPDGAVLLVANHSGQIPLDGTMIACAMLMDKDRPRIVRSMMATFVPNLPFVSTFMTHCGQVLGTPSNCKRLLQNGEAILVFPEGVAGISKTFNKRYQLQEFGTGFMRLAIENRCPIVPVAVIGAEEQYPSLFNFKALGKLLGVPAFPITPTFPFLPIIGWLPYPTKYRIYYGKAMYFEANLNEEEQKIKKYVKIVRSTIQSMINEGLKRRKHIFW
jgi:1-acyl-sn-glycerol-3-phosphate acyltransferase